MTPKVLALAAALLLPASAGVGAHHGFSSEYDEKKPLTLTGVVSKIEWMNPHARFYIDVKDASGKVTNWNFELASVNSLRRNGWTQFTLKVGDVVTASGTRRSRACRWPTPAPLDWLTALACLRKPTRRLSSKRLNHDHSKGTRHKAQGTRHNDLRLIVVTAAGLVTAQQGQTRVAAGRSCRPM